MKYKKGKTQIYFIYFSVFRPYSSQPIFGSFTNAIEWLLSLEHGGLPGGIRNGLFCSHLGTSSTWLSTSNSLPSHCSPHLRTNPYRKHLNLKSFGLIILYSTMFNLSGSGRQGRVQLPVPFSLFQFPSPHFGYPLFRGNVSSTVGRQVLGVHPSEDGRLLKLGAQID